MTAALLTPPVDDATRRQFLGVLVASGLFTACGGSESLPQPAPTTRRVTHQFGAFDVPLDPRRVVGLEGRRDLETCLALSIRPIAVGSNALLGNNRIAPFLDFSLDGVTVIKQTEPNLEKIATLCPDLILTRDSNIDELRDQLIAIAPVLPVGSGVDDAGKGDDWRADLQRVAGWLGRQPQLDDTLAGYDAQRAAVATRHANRIGGAVMAVVQYVDGSFASSSTDGFYLQARTLAELGGRHLEFLQTLRQRNPDETFRVEQTGELADADAILLIANDGKVRAEMEGQPLWQRLPAVQADHLVVTDARANYGSVYAATQCLRLLDELYSTLP